MGNKESEGQNGNQAEEVEGAEGKLRPPPVAPSHAASRSAMQRKEKTRGSRGGSVGPAHPSQGSFSAPLHALLVPLLRLFVGACKEGAVSKEAVLRTATAPRVPREGKRGCRDHLATGAPELACFSHPCPVLLPPTHCRICGETWVLHVGPRRRHGKRQSGTLCPPGSYV
ncbi:hypothetical protein MUK42_02308 [Musa troglodytarum]|uniref:Uncharacterized protein n=1 Tax=Musa troglodytarum TaxID=320322 RepID=A0A9E7JFH9_9LILI|nr:hypothetical protein MUK42_02308 [Musa troglodytarum]